MPTASDLCKKVKSSLRNIAGANYPLLNRETTGMLDAVLSQRNTTPVQQTQKIPVDGGDGKKKTAVLRYWQAQDLTDIRTTPTSVCRDGKVIEPKEEEVEVTKHISTEVFEFTDDQFRNYCEGRDEILMQTIMGLLNPFMKKFNQQIIADYNAMFGTFYGGTGGAGNPLVTRQLIRTTAGQVDQADPKGQHLILKDLRKLGLSQMPFVVGDGLLSQYMDLLQIGATNDYGQRIDALNKKMDFYADWDLGTVVGEDNAFAVWNPGAFQLVTWNKNKGEFKHRTPDREKTTFVDPVSGLELDLELKKLDCASEEGDMAWRMLFRVNYETWVMPNDIFKATDVRYGSNNAFMYEAINTP